MLTEKVERRWAVSISNNEINIMRSERCSKK
jgi:hypothetical protein